MAVARNGGVRVRAGWWASVGVLGEEGGDMGWGGGIGMERERKSVRTNAGAGERGGEEKKTLKDR